nr:VanW family protein [uncultured Porphyromonas sp.]
MDYIDQPLIRGDLRRRLGREYYILRRKVEDLASGTRWARLAPPQEKLYPLMEHHSLILRPLKDVDMYLQENKRTNLRLAIAHLDGMRICPRETCSVWRSVGRTSRAKGYLEGLVLHQGQIRKGIGGGLCQLGNLLFWLVAHSPLTITERHRHTFDVFPDVHRSVPFGAGATLSYNYIDFRFRNDTDQPFYLELWMDDTYLWGRLSTEGEHLCRYRVEERDHRVVQQMWGGYTRHNRIVRITTYPDGMEREQLLVENHAIMMYSPILSPPYGVEVPTTSAGTETGEPEGVH